MAHKRKEIKDEIVELLIAGVTSAVYRARYLPLSQREFPAICVYSPDETASVMESSEGYNRVAKIVVSGNVYGYDQIEIDNLGLSEQSDIDDKMDEMATNIESVLLKQYQTLDGIIQNLFLTNTKNYINSEGDQIIGVVIMEFDAVYYDSIL